MQFPIDIYALYINRKKMEKIRFDPFCNCPVDVCIVYCWIYTGTNNDKQIPIQCLSELFSLYAFFYVLCFTETNFKKHFANKAIEQHEQTLTNKKKNTEKGIQLKLTSLE